MTRSNPQIPDPRQADDRPVLGKLASTRIGGGLRDLYRPVEQQPAGQMPTKIRDLIEKLDQAFTDGSENA